MKSTIPFLLVALSSWVPLAGAPTYFFRASGNENSRTTLTIKSDGTCQITREEIQAKATLEFQIRNWERYMSMSESPDEPSLPKPPKAEPKALSDEELTKKLRAMYERQFESGPQTGMKIEALEVSTNSVRVVTGQAFPSLQELLRESLGSWGPAFLMIEDARLETDAEGQLHITFTPSQGAGQYVKESARRSKATKSRMEWKLVLPGKVTRSGFPETEDNATWLVYDSEKQETIDSVLKLVQGPILIVGAAGGLKLDEPLDAKKLFRAAQRRSNGEPDLPITAAGPGFVAEPLGVTLSTIHFFPGGEKRLKELPPWLPGMQSTGTVVKAELFPPRGRHIRSVSGLRVLQARDDQGRAIAGTFEESSEDDTSSDLITYHAGDSRETAAARLDLHLGLPAGDAQSIDELEAEAVVLSIGGWKEMVLTNVVANEQKEMDLGELLPGAKLIITKVSGKTPQTTVQARLEGPPGVDQIEVKVKMTENRGSSSMTQRRRTNSSGHINRLITVQAYSFGAEPGTAPSSLTLVVRLPQAMKRERVRFKLTALDLL
jgi:hypothetical protein